MDSAQQAEQLGREINREQDELKNKKEDLSDLKIQEEALEKKIFEEDQKMETLKRELEETKAREKQVLKDLNDISKTMYPKDTALRNTLVTKIRTLEGEIMHLERTLDESRRGLEKIKNARP